MDRLDNRKLASGRLRSNGLLRRLKVTYEKRNHFSTLFISQVDRSRYMTKTGMLEVVWNKAGLHLDRVGCGYQNTASLQLQQREKEFHPS